MAMQMQAQHDREKNALQQPLNARRAGPVRTKLFWVVPALEEPKQEVTVWSSMTSGTAVIMPPKHEAPPERAEARFLCAAQSPLTRLWSIVPVTRYADPDQGMVEEYGHPIAEKLEFTRMLQHLCDYEMVMETKSVPTKTEQSVKRMEYFRDFAEKEGIVFEQNTGRPSLLVNGAFPQVAGQYDAQAMERASTAFAQAASANAAADIKGTAFDRMLGGSYFHVDLDGLVNDVKALSACKHFAEHFGKASGTLSNASHKGTFVYHVERYDYTEKVDLAKQFRQHLKNCKKASDALPAGKAKSTLQDASLFAEFVYDMMALRMEFKGLISGEKVVDGEARTFKSNIEKIKDKYASTMSPENAERIANVAVDWLSPCPVQHLHLVRDSINNAVSESQYNMSLRIYGNRGLR